MLTGDIGGTNSRFALYDASVVAIADQDCVFRQSYKNAEFDTFTNVLDQFIKDAKKEVDVGNNIVAGCLAVAGPVKGNIVTFTNTVNRTAFVISAPEVEKYFHIKQVRLLNDFAANGYGLLTLSDDEVSVVCEAKNKVDYPAPIACIGAGTGLGECYMTPDANGNYTAFASEGGHCEFSPRNETEVKLLQFLQKKFSPNAHLDGEKEVAGRVSVERIVSGTGLVNVYEFLAAEHPDKVNTAHHERIMSAVEGGREISLLYHDDALCHEALNLMLSAYGAESGNVCLKYLPYGGLYIAGGIAPVHESKIIDPEKSGFLHAYRDKGRVSSVLDNIRVVIVKADDLGLRGAHFVANNLYREQQAAPKCAEPKPAQQAQQPIVQIQQPPSNLADNLFYHFGVLSMTALAVIGLTSVYKQLHQ